MMTQHSKLFLETACVKIFNHLNFAEQFYCHDFSYANNKQPLVTQNPAIYYFLTSGNIWALNRVFTSVTK